LRCDARRSKILFLRSVLSSVIKPFLAKPLSITVDVYDSFGKFLRSFLRQIVPDAAVDDPLLSGNGGTWFSELGNILSNTGLIAFGPRSFSFGAKKHRVR
jgi:hypothetical protein